MCTYFDKLELNFYFFPNKEKSLSLFALPQPLLQFLGLWPWACKLADTVEQTGGCNFSIKGKTKKQNSSLSNQIHNSPLILKNYYDTIFPVVTGEGYGSIWSRYLLMHSKSKSMKREGIIVPSRRHLIFKFGARRSRRMNFFLLVCFGWSTQSPLYYFYYSQSRRGEKKFICLLRCPFTMLMPEYEMPKHSNSSSLQLQLMYSAGV